MKKALVYILTILLTINSFAKHKDLYLEKKYGNIKTFVRTGFHNYGSTTDVEILGKLAEKLCLKLSYKDTVVIEFSHDYTNNSTHMIIVENGNSNFGFLLNSYPEKIEENQKNSYSALTGKSSICIRQLDSNFDIRKTLKLLEYSILNKFENQQNEIICKSFWYRDTKELIKVNYSGVSNTEITKIPNHKDSNLLTTVLDETIYFINDSHLKAFYEKGFYNFESEKVKFKTEALHSLIGLKEGFLIFPTNKYFIYINNNITEIVKHKAGIRGKHSYQKSTLDIFRTSKLLDNNNILIYKYSTNREGIIFSEIENKIIETYKK